MSDDIASYAGKLGMPIKLRNVLVEGTSDVALIHLVGQLEKQQSGLDFLEDLAFVAAGEKDQGGVDGLLRELITFRSIGRHVMDANGKQIYRFVGLFDNDHAGRRAIATAKSMGGLLEYRDVFRLMPIMPLPGNLDQKTVETAFNKQNEPYRGMDWEIEDLISEEFVLAFIEEFEGAVKINIIKEDKIHREFTKDGKAKFLRYIKDNAMRQDLEEVLKLIAALRCYFNLPAPKSNHQ
ncbi:hypothetical protein [Pseudomonas viridiflava]|uniref:hypothetical protein n=1 Tax=Pseudomonas viridiflava TaxID=33069 RepID=UPI000F032356|nr:hypothetical protein [Pseudomonas viridiflava]